jgi:F-type H+-transporting ATPase subunit delta
MVSVVAARYAKALSDVVETGASPADPTVIISQLRAVEEAIESSPDLRGVLASPAVPPSRKRAVIGRILDPLNVSRQVRNFLYVIIDHRRAHDLKSITEAFEDLADERMGVIRANVASAQELTAGQRMALETELSRLSGKRARPRFSVDPALIGGVVARVGSTVYDGSVRGQLDRLRAKLGNG